MNLIPSMGSIPKTQITKLLNDNTKECLTDPERFIKAISYITRIYFGLNVDSEKDHAKKSELAEVFSVFRTQVFTRYPKMTFEQFNLIYSETVIEKRQGVALTVDELMHPVASYYAKIQFVLSKKESILREQNEQAEIEAKKQAYKDESVHLYIDCVNSDKIWTGTAFHASVFAEESFKHKFTDEEKKSIYSDAWHKVRELEAERKTALMDSIPFNTPVPNNYQMFCQYLTHEACKRGFEIIVG